MFRFRKRFGISVGSALLGCGLQLNAPVLAQTAPQPRAVAAAPDLAPTNAPMSARQQAMERQRALCAQPIDLKVSGASLSQVVKQVRAAMPDASIELRLSAEDKALQRQVDENKVKLEETKLPQFRFELEQKPLGTILQSAANLAGYEFFVMPDELLISKPQELMATEQGRAIPWNFLQNSPVQVSAPRLSDADRAKGLDMMRGATQLVARQLLQIKREQGESKEPATIRFGDLDQDLQQKLQKAIDFANKNSGSPLITVPTDSFFTLGNFDKGKLSFSLTITGAYPAPTQKRIFAWNADTTSAADGQ